ncbi:MAG: alpha/beta hydrolase [Candidatus Schekmanbacteria bacterium]|nr:MAG: alpha/beta hydrolase [Candidatus Schekmanbacteria bacterium]
MKIAYFSKQFIEWFIFFKLKYFFLILAVMFLWSLFTFLVAQAVNYHKGNSIWKEKNDDITVFIFKIIATIIAEYLSILIAIILIPAGIFRIKAKKDVAYPSQRSAVLLIHGYLHNRGMLLPLKFLLRKYGIKDVYDLNLSPPFSSIIDFSQKLSEKIKKLKKEGYNSFILIGHSMGGLVALYYALSRKDLDIKKVITIGTPHKGTLFAKIALGKCGREMVPESGFLKELDSLRKEMPDLKIICFWSKLDNMIIPSGNAVAENSESYSLNYSGHITPVYSKAFAKRIVEIIQEK